MGKLPLVAFGARVRSSPYISVAGGAIAPLRGLYRWIPFEPANVGNKEGHFRWCRHGTVPNGEMTRTLG